MEGKRAMSLEAGLQRSGQIYDFDPVWILTNRQALDLPQVTTWRAAWMA
jgi:hypothetical protein